MHRVYILLLNTGPNSCLTDGRITRSLNLLTVDVRSAVTLLVGIEAVQRDHHL